MKREVRRGWNGIQAQEQLQVDTKRKETRIKEGPNRIQATTTQPNPMLGSIREVTARQIGSGASYIDFQLEVFLRKPLSSPI
jgi:hypothetical protein